MVMDELNPVFRRMVFIQNQLYTNLNLHQNELSQWIDNHPDADPSHTPFVNVFNYSSFFRTDVKEFLEMEFFHFEWFLISEFNEQLFLVVCNKHDNVETRSNIFIFPMNQTAYNAFNVVWLTLNLSYQRAMAFQLFHEILHNREQDETILTRREQEKIIQDFLPQASHHKFPLFNVKMLDPFLYQDYEQENIIDGQFLSTFAL